MGLSEIMNWVIEVVGVENRHPFVTEEALYKSSMVLEKLKAK